MIMIKLAETPPIAKRRYEQLDIHRERALPTDVVIGREELVTLLKDVLEQSSATHDYKIGYKIWKEVIQNIAGTQPEGHSRQGPRIPRKELMRSSILVDDLIKYDKRTEQAAKLEGSAND